MGISELLQKLEQIGCQFKVDGEKLKVQGPLTDKLREAIRLNKTDIIAFLQSNATEELVKGMIKERSQEANFQAEAAKVRAALKEHGIVRIFSKTLEEEVWWARDEKEARQASAGATVYTQAELEELARGNPTRKGLRQVHQCKKLFGGGLIAKEVVDMEKFEKIKGGVEHPQN